MSDVELLELVVVVLVFELGLSNPQPVFPFKFAASGPLQIPQGLAQHPLAQSAADKH